MNAKEKLDICKRCENYKYGFCKLCGCAMVLKVNLKGQGCPIDKW